MERKVYYVLAFYIFLKIDDPDQEVQKQKNFLEARDAKARIYISSEGINGQMSALEEDAIAYMAWMKQDPRFQNLEFKIHTHHENVFPKLTIKTRAQLVALDKSVDMSQTGQHVDPSTWKKMLEERDEDTILLDVRNDYEWKIGHFEGSELPELSTFRDFPRYASELKERKDPQKTKVMMCCTGGIRCELYSALLKQEGFENVVQLEGGIIKYGLQEGSEHFKGKLFVFDDRLAVPIDGKEGETIAECKDCQTKSDLYYNCANVDCNALFISCASCAEKSAGCCSPACLKAPRVRAFTQEARPYRKWLDKPKMPS